MIARTRVINRIRDSLIVMGQVTNKQKQV